MQYYLALLISLLSILIGPSRINAQNLDSLIIAGKQELNLAVRKWQETDLLKARAYFERLATAQPKSVWAHYYVALADYRLISFYFTKESEKQKEKHIDDAIERLKKAIEIDPACSEAYSLLGSVYGQKITNMFNAMLYGSKSSAAIENGLKLEPENPRAWLIAGISSYYKPESFGGGAPKALEQLETAVRYFNTWQSAGPQMPEWGHDEAYAWMGIAHIKTNQLEQANTDFQKALAINPHNAWVLRQLLPALKKKQAETTHH